MTYVSIVAAVASLVGIALLVLLMNQVRQIASDVTRLPSTLKPTPAPAPPVSPTRDRTEERLAAIENRLAGLGMMLDRLDRMIAEARVPEPAPRRAEPATPPATIAPEPAPQDPAPAPRPRSEPGDADTRTWTPPAAEPSPAAPPEPDAAETDATLDQFVDDFRQLLAQARKSEINRWFEQYESVGCEAGEDDTLTPVEREAGPLLMLVPFAPNAALLLPSARLVADFATSFSDTLALRGALRRTFALEVDGSGILRLAEAALAIRRDGRWRLKKPGILSGLTS